MRRLLLTGLMMTLAITSHAQDNPVHWYFSSKKIKGSVYVLHLKATIDPPYHIYAQKSESEVALPTKITFTPSPLTELQGEVSEKGDLQNHKDATSGAMFSYYADEVDFVQIVKLKHKGKTKVKGHINYMACTNDHCLPEAKQVFTINIGQ